ncbi:DUF1905 domain-containing protein [Altererythrobacter salegens]|uniref:DUF1905 domain-containing protein n=1 Tax=Croceibacterium salegens TaxID=1737568 RepID=A0A6I4SUY3_9SPHN|nr:DUF1905 domain-containing protein [Croceibacterium salegens]MXO58172.1 DUF1905 domain-containing protein [Croceibacterium salegens]
MTTVRFVAPLQSMIIEEGMPPIGFVHLTDEAAEQVTCHELERRLELGKRRGFGSVKVTVRVGESEWQTSAFPSQGRWFLPIKKPVRLAEDLAEGEPVEVELDLL